MNAVVPASPYSEGSARASVTSSSPVPMKTPPEIDVSIFPPPTIRRLSRRSQHLRRRLRLVPPGEGLHLVLDSTGLSIVGAGEWAAATHGRVDQGVGAR